VWRSGIWYFATVHGHHVVCPQRTSYELFVTHILIDDSTTIRRTDLPCNRGRYNSEQTSVDEDINGVDLSFGSSCSDPRSELCMMITTAKEAEAEIHRQPVPVVRGELCSYRTCSPDRTPAQ